MRRVRLTVAAATAFASMAAAGVRAQEVDPWIVAEVTGRSQQAAATASREEVKAELQRAREEGTYHAGNEGPTPDAVLERRKMANQRQVERVARAYQDEADRIARIMNEPATTR